MNDPTVIIGAGPAGMACAMELWKDDRPSIVIEKNNQVGGLARTIVIKEGSEIFRTDIGPHRFFSKNPYLYSFIEDLLGEQWITVNRQTRFFIDDQFYFYPLQMKNALKNIGLIGATKVLFDYFIERVHDLNRPQPPANFEDFSIRTFGQTLAELNMLNYTQKIWGIPCNELSVDWAHQRIKGLNFKSALKSMITTSSTGNPKTLVDSFYYPEYGAGLIYESIYKRVRPDTRFHLSSLPTRLQHNHDHVTALTFQTPSGQQLLPLTNLVTTIPLPELLKLLDPAPPASIIAHEQHLRYRSQVYLFITIDKSQIFPDQWIYFPELNIPFGRVSEMKNFSPQMAPASATSLFIEFFCWENDDIWHATENQLLQKCLPFLEKIGWLEKSDIRHVYKLRQAKVYPVYDLEYKQHLQAILQYLDSFNNLYTIGRPGRFKYNNQDHSLEMGILAARSIIENKRYDINTIASGQEYFESGFVPSRQARSAHPHA